MANVFRGRGFKDHKQEEKRREKEKESRTGKLWRFFLGDDDDPDAPIRFLTEEPILFYEHSINVRGKWANITCTGDDCEECAEGDRPSYKGAWLVVDGREVEIDEKDAKGKKTGKKKIITDQIRLYVRGSTDIAKLDRLSKKWGLTSRPWFVTKTGKDTSTSYELDRGEEEELSEKELKNILSKMPEKMRNHYTGEEEELYDIVEYNIFDDVELSGSESDDDDDDDEDEKPKGSKFKKGNKKTSKKASKRSRDDEDEDDDDEDDDDVDSGVQRLGKRTSSKPKAGKKLGKSSSKVGKKKLSKR